MQCKHGGKRSKRQVDNIFNIYKCSILNLTIQLFYEVDQNENS